MPVATAGERMPPTDIHAPDAEWHDLSQPFHEGMPHAAVHPAPRFEPVSDVERDGIGVTEFTAVTHVGTHVDAPRHFVPGGATIDDLPLSRFAGEGVVVDVRCSEPREIGIDDVRDAPGEVRDGDVVVLHTGWCERYGDEDYDPHPWLSPELASWFVDRDAKLVGVDTITPDIPGARRPEGWMEYPVHRELLGDGVLIAEHLGNLAPVTGERLEIVGFPIPIRGGDGAQARFAARALSGHER